MPIPNADSAHVPPEKLTDYLLNEQHPVGGSKAKWFHDRGYAPADPEILEHDLLRLVRTSEAFLEIPFRFGIKYVVSSGVQTPNGEKVNLVTVWVVESNEIYPRLVTAYPGAT